MTGKRDKEKTPASQTRIKRDFLRSWMRWQTVCSRVVLQLRELSSCHWNFNQVAAATTSLSSTLIIVFKKRNRLRRKETFLHNFSSKVFLCEWDFTAAEMIHRQQKHKEDSFRERVIQAKFGEQVVILLLKTLFRMNFHVWVKEDIPQEKLETRENDSEADW